jgi:hypothetical protein
MRVVEDELVGEAGEHVVQADRELQEAVEQTDLEIGLSLGAYVSSRTRAWRGGMGCLSRSTPARL